MIGASLQLGRVVYDVAVTSMIHVRRPHLTSHPRGQGRHRVADTPPADQVPADEVGKAEELVPIDALRGECMEFTPLVPDDRHIGGVTIKNWVLIHVSARLHGRVKS